MICAMWVFEYVAKYLGRPKKEVPIISALVRDAALLPRHGWRFSLTKFEHTISIRIIRPMCKVFIEGLVA